MSLDGKQYYSVIFDEVGISDADRQGCARAPSPLILLTRLNELRTVRAKEWNSCHVASPAKWGALARIVLASACLPGSSTDGLCLPRCVCPRPSTAHAPSATTAGTTGRAKSNQRGPLGESATTARHHGGHWETRRNNYCTSLDWLLLTPSLSVSRLGDFPVVPDTWITIEGDPNKLGAVRCFARLQARDGHFIPLRFPPRSQPQSLASPGPCRRARPAPLASVARPHTLWSCQPKRKPQ